MEYTDSDSASLSVAKPIKLYLIRPVPFDVAFNSPAEQQFRIAPSDVIHALLDVNRFIIANGAQKTFNRGVLTFSHVPSSIDSSSYFHNLENVVAVKRLFEPKGTLPTSTVTPADILRLSSVQEMALSVDEGNLLYWAHMLMNMVDSFVTAKIAGASEPPPFDIPALRFVEGGIGVSNSGVLHGKPENLQTTFIVEEALIGRWVKYIGNGSAAPALKSSDVEYELAEYLCFVQHAQYEKTGYFAYVSDFQGTRYSC